jgi:hypothetical protein
MLNTRILLKSLNDIEIKLMFCKTAFEWGLFAEKFEQIVEKIRDFYTEEDVPEEIESAMSRTRDALVIKKGELPPSDYSEFFK